MPAKRPTPLLVLLILGLAACGGVTTYVIDSRPPGRQIAIDGRADEWVGALCTIANVEVGFLNDRDYLYISFISDDQALRRAIARSGLIVWFDPNGGSARALGIKYPLGMASRPNRGGPTDRENPGQPTPEAPAMSEPGAALEILKPAGKSGVSRQRMDIADLKGAEIAVSMAADSDTFVYELKIPLNEDAAHPLALGAQAGKTVGIGFEVAKPSLGGGGGRPRGVPGGGGIPGGGGRTGGMYGGGRRGGRMGAGDRGDFESAEGLKIWTSVRLAASSTPAPAALLER